MILKFNTTRDEIAQVIPHIDNVWSEMVILISYLALYYSISNYFYKYEGINFVPL